VSHRELGSEGQGAGEQAPEQIAGRHRLNDCPKFFNQFSTLPQCIIVIAHQRRLEHLDLAVIALRAALIKDDEQKRRILFALNPGEAVLAGHVVQQERVARFQVDGFAVRHG
jgi:hypothetical protein